METNARCSSQTLTHCAATSRLTICMKTWLKIWTCSIQVISNKITHCIPNKIIVSSVNSKARLAPYHPRNLLVWGLKCTAWMWRTTKSSQKSEQKGDKETFLSVQEEGTIQASYWSSCDIGAAADETATAAAPIASCWARKGEMALSHQQWIDSIACWIVSSSRMGTLISTQLRRIKWSYLLCYNCKFRFLLEKDETASTSADENTTRLTQRHFPEETAPMGLKANPQKRCKICHSKHVRREEL